ncbi:unnamed protein product [Adineta steineri]|uniref:Carrier domain-containing protein n=1 Tax=Adineta steineri TaxID=433720 RepID=A0A818WQU9_9BILA|nr:unnamed protein product [Adineta steineri]CAF3729427.1 unnamed protein product [Adineta steineri]
MTTSFYVLRQLFDTARMYSQKVAVVLDDQTWTYSELIEQIEQVVCHLHRLNIAQGQIIYQFVERGFEMICGFFGIMCAGGVYCSLNPTDPYERLVSIIEQMQGRYVLVHRKTHSQYPETTVGQQILFLDEILSPLSTIEDMDDLPNCKEYGAAFIICTSGTTGRQKAVVHTFKSFAACMLAFIQWDLDLYTSRNQVLQVATSSWIVHVSEVALPVIVGGTLVLMRPNGHLNMAYFSETLIHQQVTTLTINPGILRALTNYLEITQRLETFEFVRNMCLAGEAMKPKQLTKLFSILQLYHIQVCTIYGMSECHTALGCQIQNFDDNCVPMGYSMPAFRCLLIDEHGQTIYNTKKLNEVGQLVIGGSSLFTGYLDNLERTASMFITIDNQLYMKTGDLARYNARDELVHAGRIDFQIKVHGQRVETAEIENTIMNWSPDKISNCLVTKALHNDDLLVAYIISNDLELDTKEIQDYCKKYLRQYMVPSYIVVMDKFPLNANGKVDRKNLPLPTLHYNMQTKCVLIEDQPMSELEEKVYNLWCSTLQLDVVPHDMSCFALGGSSISLMQLFNYYQFHLVPDKQINVLDFFTNQTIADHVRLLISSKSELHTVWSPLHLVQGRASYAQENIWLAEQTRFIQHTPPIPSYNSSTIYRIDSGHLSIKQCLRTIDLIVSRHMVFHTRFTFNVDRGYLEQSIIENKSYGGRSYPVYVSTVEREQEFKALGFQETLMSLDDAVFRCHFVRFGHTNPDTLKEGDFIIFTFHHGSFDSTAENLFLNEFTLGYCGKYDFQESCLQYIDYATYERSHMDMNEANEYWRKALRGYSWDRQLDLPYDFGAPTNAHRSGKCWFLGTDVSSKIVDAMITGAKVLNTTLFQLTLTCFYIFLAQLSPHNQDACVTIPIKNRYRPELENIIGMFVNMLPCRVIVDASSASTMTFVDLLHKVQNNLTNMMKYGNMSYLELLELHRAPSVDLQFPFIHAYLTLITSTDNSHLDKHQLNLTEPSSNQNICSLSQYLQLNEPGDENSDLFVSTPFQQLDITPLVKLIPMANEPINLWINNKHEQLNRTIKVLTPLEKHIQTIYSRVLDTEQIDVYRSFFEQGGTSVKALQVIYLLQENTMTAMIDANLFFGNPSVTGLAQLIENKTLIK